MPTNVAAPPTPLAANPASFRRHAADKPCFAKACSRSSVHALLPDDALLGTNVLPRPAGGELQPWPMRKRPKRW